MLLQKRPLHFANFITMKWTCKVIALLEEKRMKAIIISLIVTLTYNNLSESIDSGVPIVLKF